ncbi:MAG: MATE family efflux transporter, partial [Oscillospiraceae bacterium]
LAITVGLADSLMVASVGEAAVSAVSLVDTVNVLLVNAFAALGTGGAMVAGQYLGRREKDRAEHAASQLVLFMLAVSLGITLLMYLGRHFILHVVFGNIQPDVAAYANTYFLIAEASIPFLAMYSAGAALFRVMGNSKISMQVSLVMNVINVVGNAVLVFGFQMEVAGVAIPTLVSRMVAAGLMVVLLHKPGQTLRLRFTLRPEKRMVRNILRFGVTNGIESSMFQLGKILLLAVVSVLGTASIAANAIGNALGNFQCLPGTAIGLAMVTVVSHCVGAGDYAQARHYTKKMMQLAYLTMLVINLAILAALPLVLPLYHPSAETYDYAMKILWMHGTMSILLWPAAFTLPQALRAAGDTRYTLVVGSLSMWTFRVVFGVLLARVWGFGVLGIWMAMFIDWICRVICFVLRYRGHRWELLALGD